jgi:hypothetical protein
MASYYQWLPFSSVLKKILLSSTLIVNVRIRTVHAVVIIYLMIGILLAGDLLQISAQLQEKKPSFLKSNDIVYNPTTGNPVPFLNKSSITVLSHNSFVDSVGFFHVVGEVGNNTPNTAKSVQITGTFYDINNAVVGTQFTYTNPSDISSGATALFDLALMSTSVPPSLIDHYKLSTNYQ